MAMFRRRRRGFRRNFGRPFAQRRLAWVTAIFNESSMSASAAFPTELVLLQGDDWSQNSNLQSDEKIRRIIFNATFGVIPLTTALGQDFFSAIWALYVIDNDESREVDAASTALWDTHRILQSGVLGGTALEGTTAQTPSNVFPGWNINVDISRGLPRVNRDELVVFSIRMMSDASSALNVVTLSALSRVLIDA